MSETVEVGREYLWALEVMVAHKHTEYEASTAEIQDAIRVIVDANLRRPLDRNE